MRRNPDAKFSSSESLLDADVAERVARKPQGPLTVLPSSSVTESPSLSDELVEECFVPSLADQYSVSLPWLSASPWSASLFLFTPIAHPNVLFALSRTFLHLDLMSVVSAWTLALSKH